MSTTALVVFIITTLCFLSCAQNVEYNGSRVVLTREGPVRGYKQLGRTLYEFYGVPYARVPKDSIFKAPLSAKPRSNTTIFEAVDWTIICPQGTFPEVDWAVMKVREQCLIANIFVPETKEKKLAVLVYVHGGAFQFGFGNIKKLTQFAEQYNIIAVNFNYRLGVTGNLCLGTKNAPGNAAMKDQIELLHWVKKNIEYFGGDPNKITISGCSSGGSSVDLLALSKATKGLFRNMIVNSGSCLNAYSIQSDPIEEAINTAHVLNLPNVYPNVKSLDRVYKDTPIKDLSYGRAIDINNLDTLFSPCLERNGSESVLSDTPYKIFQENTFTQIPILYTYSQMEGSRKAAVFDKLIKKVRENFSDLLPNDLKFKDDEEKKSVANMIKDLYFKGVHEKNISIPYMDYFSDTLFTYGVLRSADLHVESGNQKIYLLEFSYITKYSTLIPHTSIRRARHCSQAQLVWDEDETNSTEGYRTVKTFIKESWANFIKTEDPAPKGITWPPLSRKLGPVMIVDTKIELKPQIDQSMLNRFNLWKKIYSKYYRVPIPPI